MYGINAYYRTFELYIFFRKCNKSSQNPCTSKWKMSEKILWIRYANKHFKDFLCLKVCGLAWRSAYNFYQSEFGNMKIAGWTGPRRVFLQNNYLIFFRLFFWFFTVFSKKRESDRVTARVTGSQRRTGPCRTGSYGENRWSKTRILKSRIRQWRRI